jgi:hypothetical protein
MKVMPVSCANIVKSWISLEMFLVINMKFISENLYSHKILKISKLVNRLLHEFVGLALAMILIIFLL